VVLEETKRYRYKRIALDLFVSNKRTKGSEW
jgi:hypothetical protein